MAKRQQIYVTSGGHSTGSLVQYGWTMSEHVANPPALRTAYVDVPFGDGCYDFSNVYGARYDMRTVSITFSKAFEDYDTAVSDVRAFEAWLLSLHGAKLYDTALGIEFGTKPFALMGAAVTECTHSINGGSGKSTVSVVITAQPRLSDGSI